MKKIVVALLAAAALAACSEPAPPPAPAPAPPAPAPAAAPAAAPAPEAAPAAAAAPAPVAVGDPKAEAETIFTQRCTVCHGATGKGDGVGAAALNPKPRDYGDAAWQKSVTDEQIAKIIVEGGPSIGKSPLMAPNADLANKPDVVKALVAKVRSFGSKS